MGFQCGIVGLPNVGKSTIFNALTSAKAEAANYPFCTIEPNTGIVGEASRSSIEKNCRVYSSSKTHSCSIIPYVDIAGLVKGASKGEGLGNQFLGHIRETNAIAHVVRCFQDPNIIHVDGSVDPLRDISVIDTELMLTDLEAVTKKLPMTEKMAKQGDKKAGAQLGVLIQVKAALEQGKPVRAIGLNEEELAFIHDYHFIHG